MNKFPVDAPITRVKRALVLLGFRLVREGSHISMVRENGDGTRTPLTMPNHPRLKSSTLRTILTQAGIDEMKFLGLRSTYFAIRSPEWRKQLRSMQPTHLSIVCQLRFLRSNAAQTGNIPSSKKQEQELSFSLVLSSAMHNRRVLTNMATRALEKNRTSRK